MAALNPLRCGGTSLPIPLLLAAKIVALALLLTNHVRLMPDPFLPFVPVLDALPGPAFRLGLQAVFVVSAVALLLNQWVRVSALVLGSTLLLAVVASKAYYGNNKTMCGCLLFLIGLYHERTGSWLIRVQLALVYFGAGLNKMFDADWWSGQFFEHWAAVRLRQPVYVWLASALPPLVAAKFFCYSTIASEMVLSVALLAPRCYGWALWLSVLFQAALMEFSGSMFTMFFYVMQASMLAFVAWPRELVVIYDGDCGICNQIRRALERCDFDGVMRWEAFQTGIGERWGIARSAVETRLHLVADGRVYGGFAACKLLLLYLPAFLLLLTLVLAAPPNEGWVWFRRLFVAAWLAFFFPWFDRIGEWCYLRAARNRYRVSAACAIEPNPKAGPRP